MKRIRKWLEVRKAIQFFKLLDYLTRKETFEDNNEIDNLAILACTLNGHLNIVCKRLKSLGIDMGKQYGIGVLNGNSK